MIKLIKSLWWEFLSYFVPEKMEYEITGECKKCGKCCNYMYSFDTYTEKEFKIMQFLYPAYKRFYIKGKDEFGNFIFACKYVTKEGLCSVYDKRLAMCKRYPMPKKLRLVFEKSNNKWLPFLRYPALRAVPLKIKYPADLHEGCGFTIHKKKFSDYLNQANEDKNA